MRFHTWREHLPVQLEPQAFWKSLENLDVVFVHSTLGIKILAPQKCSDPISELKRDPVVCDVATDIITLLGSVPVGRLDVLHGRGDAGNER